MSNRKPHMMNAGYVTERKSHHPKLPGHFVVYDRDATPSPGIDADERWIVMHEPSSHHIAVSSRRHAQDLMCAMAAGSDDADFGQHDRPECKTCLSVGMIRDGDTNQLRKCLDCNGTGEL